MVIYHALDQQLYRGTHRNVEKGLGIRPPVCARYTLKEHSSLSM